MRNDLNDSKTSLEFEQKEKEKFSEYIVRKIKSEEEGLLFTLLYNYETKDLNFYISGDVSDRGYRDWILDNLEAFIAKARLEDSMSDNITIH